MADQSDTSGTPGSSGQPGRRRWRCGRREPGGWRRVQQEPQPQSQPEPQPEPDRRRELRRRGHQDGRRRRRQGEPAEEGPGRRGPGARPRVAGGSGGGNRSARADPRSRQGQPRAAVALEPPPPLEPIDVEPSLGAPQIFPAEVAANRRRAILLCALDRGRPGRSCSASSSGSPSRRWPGSSPSSRPAPRSCTACGGSPPRWRCGGSVPSRSTSTTTRASPTSPRACAPPSG